MGLLGINSRALQDFDWVLLVLMSAVLGIGLTNLFSATLPGAAQGLPLEFRRQLFALTLGAVGFGVAAWLDYRHLERFAPLLFVACVLLLLATLVAAPVTRGSRSWFIVGAFSFQPAEAAKLGLVLMLAKWFHRNPPHKIRNLRALLMPGLIIAAPVGTILLQRDMGVAVLTLLIGVSFLLFVNIRLRAWLMMFALGVGAASAVWRFGLRGYQRERILDFFDPTRDPLASGYQAIQSLIAVGSGGFFGQGYRSGSQTQLQFLPTQHSDFAFSVLAEEWGFAGCVFLLSVYFGMLIWGLVIAANAKDNFGALLAAGIVSMLFWPALINVAMVLGLLPVIGVPLPLVSYGGSQLLINLIALGLLMNISMRRYMF